MQQSLQSNMYKHSVISFLTAWLSITIYFCVSVLSSLQLIKIHGLKRSVTIVVNLLQ